MKFKNIVSSIAVAITIALVGACPASGQVIYGDTVLTELPEEQREAFLKSIKQKVLYLQHYISKIADKSIDLNVRLEMAESAVGLFYSDENIVQISNLKTGSIAQLPVRLYFRKLANIKATKVEITFYKGVQFETVRKGTDGYYYGTALMFQETTISKGENVVSYKDRTVKRVNFKTRQEYTWIGDERIDVIETFLQDINVKETTI